MKYTIFQPFDRNISPLKETILYYNTVVTARTGPGESSETS